MDGKRGNDVQLKIEYLIVKVGVKCQLNGHGITQSFCCCSRHCSIFQKSARYDFTRLLNRPILQSYDGIYIELSIRWQAKSTRQDELGLRQLAEWLRDSYSGLRVEYQ